MGNAAIAGLTPLSPRQCLAYSTRACRAENSLLAIPHALQESLLEKAWYNRRYVTDTYSKDDYKLVPATNQCHRLEPLPFAQEQAGIPPACRPLHPLSRARGSHCDDALH